MTKKIGIALGSFLGLAPLAAFAQYSTSTAASQVDTVTNGVGAMFAQNIPTMLVIMIALIGLGWGVRKFQKHVSGKKF